MSDERDELEDLEDEEEEEDEERDRLKSLFLCEHKGSQAIPYWGGLYAKKS